METPGTGSCSKWNQYQHVSAPLARNAIASRIALALLALSAFAAALVTAGPGNGVQPAREVREVRYVNLPTVHIVGKRDDATRTQQARVAPAALGHNVIARAN